MRVLDLFSGIGGFSLGLEKSDFETVGFCEIEEFPKKILKKHWPNVPIHNDVRTIDELEGFDSAEVITAGFPCQDISFAGEGAGLSGSRSGLWWKVRRAIRLVRPRFALLENVAAMLNRGVGAVLGSLAAIGYDTEWHCIPASYVGAPHRRDRIWIIAHTESERLSEAGRLQREQHPERVCSSSEESCFADFISKRLQGCGEESIQGVEGFSWCKDVRGIEDLLRRSDLYTPALCRASDGIPDWVDRTKCLGNTVVPQIPEIIGKAIMDYIGEK